MFGQLLIDPTSDEVKAAAIDALATALRAPNDVETPLPVDLREELPGLWKVPEGWQVWYVNPRAMLARVGVAWWTDPTGRLHVRIGGAAQLDPISRRFFADWPGLTPLARVHPGRSYLRCVANQPRLVVACDCGVNGLPDALGWMGPCCGPCYDRQLECGVEVLINSAPLAATAVSLPQPAHVLAISPDGRRMATAVRGERFRLWDVATGSEIGTADDCSPNGASLNRSAVEQVSFNADGSLLAAIRSEDHSLGVWQISEGRWLRDLPDVRPVISLLFAGNVLVVNTGNRLHLWEAAEGAQMAYRGDRRCQVSRMAAAPVGFPVALSHASGHQLLILPSLSAELESIRAPSLYPSALAVAAEGRFLAARESQESAIRIYDVRERRFGARIRMIYDDIRAMTFSPYNSRRLLTAGREGRVHTWDALTGRERDAMHWHASAVFAMAFSADGRLLATSGEDGVVKFWPWRTLLGD